MDWIYESQSWFNLKLLDSIQLYLSWNEMRVLKIITVENWVIRIRCQKYLFSSISQPSILCLGRPLFHFSEASAGICCISYAINKATVSSLNWVSRLCGHTQEGTSTHDKHESKRSKVWPTTDFQSVPRKQSLYDDQPDIDFHVLQLHRHFLCTMHHTKCGEMLFPFDPTSNWQPVVRVRHVSLVRMFIPLGRDGYDHCVYVKRESLNANSPSNVGFCREPLTVNLQHAKQKECSSMFLPLHYFASLKILKGILHYITIHNMALL